MDSCRFENWQFLLTIFIKLYIFVEEKKLRLQCYQFSLDFSAIFSISYLPLIWAQSFLIQRDELRDVRCICRLFASHTFAMRTTIRLSLGWCIVPSHSHKARTRKNV